MNAQTKHPFDINSELLIKRHRDGITLVKPNAQSGSFANSVLSIFNLPFSTYFLDSSSHFIKTNEATAVLVGCETSHEMRGCTNANFCGREFSDKLFAIDRSIVSNQSSRLIEETGFRSDDYLIQVISLKLPLYYRNQVVGLLGFSINSDSYSLPEFANNMTQLISTGLLGSSQATAQAALPTRLVGDVYLTKREMEVLSYVVRGKTAKRIGLSLMISNRTVEKHIENIRLKTKCNSKSELCDEFFDEFNRV